MDDKARILIIDDTPANIKLLTDILRDEFTLSVATSGPDGLAIAADPATLPDLVLLDIMMPDMDGYEVCKRLKAEKATSDVPVIFVTAMQEVQDETRGFDVGAVDFIAKPISPPVVLSRVRSAIGLKRKTERLEELSHKLSRYLSPQVYASIFEGRTDARIESRRKKLTVFFSDIVGFTETTERLEAEEMSALLNSYLERMSRIVINHGGTIDKYMGDAIMAFFGDPESRGEKEDALACVTMAMDMRAELTAFQKQWYERGVETPFRVRAGINTGYCTVGNFGSPERMEYTIIGGQVNIASRLETGAEPDQILISHETWSLVRDKVFCIRRKPLTLKGIPYPVQTYQVVDFIENMRTGEGGVSIGDLAQAAPLAGEDTPLREVRELMDSSRSGTVVVTGEGGQPVGLVGSLSMGCMVNTFTGSPLRADDTARDAMDAELLVVEAGTSLAAAARLATARDGHRALADLVVGGEGGVRGVVPVRLLLERLAELYDQDACTGDA